MVKQLVSPKISVNKETRTQDTIEGKTITSKHAPVGNIKYGNIEATSFVKIDNENEDIAIIMKQNNYTHLHLQTIASQLSHLEETWFPCEKGKKKINNNNLKLVLIKPPILSNKFNIRTPLNEEFIEKLTKKFGTLKINDSIKVISESDNIESLISQFSEKIEMVKPSVQTPLPTSRNYYSRPTPASILFEENSFGSALCYNSKTIYEWNIDGQSEY